MVLFRERVRTGRARRNNQSGKTNRMEIQSEMKQPNANTEEMTEDMFEKAREAFFRPTDSSPKSSVSSNQPLEPQDEGSDPLPIEEAHVHP